MAIITFIMGLIVGWKGWKFFNKLICWTFIILFIANLIAIAKSGNVGESIAFVLIQFTVLLMLSMERKLRKYKEENSNLTS